jgi:hypothetical protein
MHHLRQPQWPHATGTRPCAELLASDSMHKHNVETFAIVLLLLLLLLLL